MVGRSVDRLCSWDGFVTIVFFMDYRNITQETPLFQQLRVNTGLVCLKTRQKRYNKNISKTDTSHPYLSF